MLELAERRPEELADDAEGEVALELRAAGGECRQSSLLGKRARCADERGLADPRRALDNRHRALTLAGALDQPLELGELGVAFEKRSRAHFLNPVSRHGGHDPTTHCGGKPNPKGSGWPPDAKTGGRRHTRLMIGRLEISMELELTTPVSGLLRLASGEERPFQGWLEMHSNLEQLCAQAQQELGGGITSTTPKAEGQNR